MIEVNDQAHLERLPDGSIITWLRILGDETSRAVAFVHVEREYATNGDSEPVDRTVWISPGGWQPMAPGDAGITYPVSVVQLGGGDIPGPAQMLMDVLPSFQAPAFEAPQFDTLISGGTYPRDTALAAAARVWAGMAVSSKGFVSDRSVLDTAEAFAAWLDPEPPSPQPPEPELVDFTQDELTAMGVDPVELPLSQRLMAAADTIAEADAHQAGGPSITVSINLEAVRRYALKLAGEGK